MYGLYLFYIFFIFSPVFGVDLPPPISLQIPMRDGKELAADLYLPSQDAKGLPCILIRSPAGRQTPYALMHLALLEEGYALVIQETRSAADPLGKTVPFQSDGWGELQDGYDTVVFLAKSPYTNGKIGTMGASALGITQLLMAPTEPPGLEAQYVAFAASNLHKHGLYQGGVLCKHQVEGWLGYYAKDPSVYKTIYLQPIYNDYWQQFNMLPLVSQCSAPTLHLAGWNDVFLKGTLEAYTALQENGGSGAKGKQKLIIGPWTHLWPLVTNFGEYAYPEPALNPPFDWSAKSWFACHLKGEKALKELPNILYYVMGPLDSEVSSGNVWKTAEKWPLPHLATPWHLTTNKALSRMPGEDALYQYNYNPDQPVPTIGGRNLFLLSGPCDQSSIEKRPDLVVFTSAPLEEDLEITGDVLVRLFVSTDQEETAFSARLTDVYPDGKSLLIADGIQCLKKTISGPAEIEIDLWPTSLVFAKGHQIRLIVSSSNYPRFEKNLNTSKRMHHDSSAMIAKNSIYTGPTYPSRIILPVIK